jgi:omega-hydroxy-beta-dihydromenaquinone-9 sulfotransferase
MVYLFLEQIMKLQYSPYRHLRLNMHAAFGYTLWNWLTVLWKNNFRVDVSSVLKITWITLSILSTAVFRVYESIVFDAKVKKVEIKSPIFILGYPRSGTTYLHYLLSKDKQFSYCATYQVLMPNVFLSLGKTLIRMLDKILPKRRIMDNLKMDTMLPKEEEFAISAISDASMINGFYFPENATRYLDEYVLFKGHTNSAVEWKKKLKFFLQKVQYGQESKRMLIKSPFNTGRVKQILELFPDAKFIHIHRNPYEVYYSNEKLHEAIIPAFSFQRVSSEHMERFVFDSYRLIYENYFEASKRIPEGNLVTVSYEKLVENPIATLDCIYKSLSI